MVTKEEIEEIITKSINIVSKCSDYRIGTLTLPNNVKREMRKFREETKDLTHETLILLDENGERVFDKDGSVGRVDYSNVNFNELISDGHYNLIAEHNHPGAYGETISGANGSVTVASNSLIATVLSDGDVHQLWHTGVSLVGDAVIRTPIKGIVAECPNGSRMSLIRKDGFEDKVTGENGENRGANLVKFEKTYEILHNKWNHYREDYETQLKIHMNHWSKAKDESNPNWTLEDYNKEKIKFSKKYNKEYFNEKYLSDVIEDFDEQGFELSIDWIF